VFIFFTDFLFSINGIYIFIGWFNINSDYQSLKKYFYLQDNLDESHDLDDTDDYEDEGIDVESADEDIDAVDTEQEVSKKNEHKPKKYQKPDKWTLGKITPEKLKAEREKEKHQSGNKFF
jgi:hypothetical protein